MYFIGFICKHKWNMIYWVREQYLNILLGSCKFSVIWVIPFKKTAFNQRQPEVLLKAAHSTTDCPNAAYRIDKDTYRYTLKCFLEKRFRVLLIKGCFVGPIQSNIFKQAVYGTAAQCSTYRTGYLEWQAGEREYQTEKKPRGRWVTLKEPHGSKAQEGESIHRLNINHALHKYKV